jgi:hypothetical protein
MFHRKCFHVFPACKGLETNSLYVWNGLVNVGQVLGKPHKMNPLNVNKKYADSEI